MSPTTSPDKSDTEMAQSAFGAIPTTITTAVANRLREEIRSGTLTPGTRLRQAHIAESYGVSTTPVREAFAALEREGLIQSNAHRGVIVFEPSIVDLREIYEIRTPLEALATELGAVNLTEADLKKMKALIKQIGAANRKKDWPTAGECNDEFHHTIYARADRQRLLKLITDLRDASSAYIGLFPRLPGRMKEVEREHKEIYEFCAAHQPKKAAKAMIAHLTYTGNAIQQHIEEGGE
jgi:DNA-binding GntR family transcriptional regulator